MNGITIALEGGEGDHPMRTSLVALVVCSLVPATALADDVADPLHDPQRIRVGASTEGGYIVPQAVPYEGGDIPANAKIVSKPNIAFVGTGVGLLATSYAGALIYGLATCSAQEACRQGSGFLYIPFIGPFITAATAPTTGGSALAAFDGGVQVLGAALAVAGFLAPQKFVMWQSKSAKLTVMPTVTGAPSDKGGMGAGLSITVTHL
jgi:hypothetical protein